MNTYRGLRGRGAGRLARSVALALLVLPPLALSAGAQDADTQVLVTGYLFASGIDGRSSVTSGLPPADIDLSFGDVLEDLDFGVMSAVEVRRGRWGFLGDLMYSKVSPSASVSGFPPLSGGLDQQSVTLQGNILYRVHEDVNLALDLGGGLRYWSIDNDARIGVTGGPALSFSDSASWVDPVIAARLAVRLGGPWSMTLAADYGGFGVGSDETWQLLGTLNWQKNERLTFRAGYRVLSVDYRDDGFVHDVRMEGPVVGMTVRF